MTTESTAWWKRLFNIKEHKCACQSEIKSLSQADTGQHVRIECLRGEEGVCQRLREMGFCESSVVEKIADTGALICKVCDAKVVISKDLGKNIIVKEVCECKGHTMEGKNFLLSQMPIGQPGIIKGFTIESDDCERIAEMGLTPGERVEVIRYAPLGDPVEIKIRGYCLSLRKEEADMIMVTLAS